MEMIFGLDIGTRSIVGTVGYKNNANRFQIVSQVVKEHETRAMLDGQIHDIDAVSKTISEVKTKLEKNIGFPLKEVCIAAAGRVLKTVHVTAEHIFDSDTVITKEMVHSLDLLGVEQAYDKLKVTENMELFRYYHVGYTVIKYYLNDYIMLSLEGHKGTKISAEVLATFLPEEVIDGLYKAVEMAGLKVANLTLEPIAAMEVAIPENLRLLNLALVDVGAGTSDISVTRDGSIIAFGMIPCAGDEITEYIAKKYLVDFNAAEKIKQSCLKKKAVSFKDILGISHKIVSSELIRELDGIVERITSSIADKIIDLNGGKPVSAVFIVGGGGKLPNFATSLAKALQLPEERVSLRGKEVLGEVDFEDEKAKKDSMLVTPIGICLNYYNKRNNFQFVTVNGEVVKLYDNNHLTVMDAAMAVGISTLDLFPRRGEALTFTLNNEARMIRGESGEPAQIYVNKKQANMTTPLASHDVIDIIPSEPGKTASLTVGELKESKETMKLYFNGRKIELPVRILADGVLVTSQQNIRSGMQLTVDKRYTVEELLQLVDIDVQEISSIEINEKHALLIDEIRNEDNVQVKYNAPMTVIVNGSQIELLEKESYCVVDVLDVYPFDLSKAGEKKLVILVNGEEAEFSTPIHEMDEVTLMWKE